jgi:hypothetical protein
VSKEEFIEIVKTSFSKSEVCRKLGYPAGGAGFRKINLLLKEYDTTHFNGNRKIKYPRIGRVCPVCEKKFIVGNGDPKAKVTCSYACSNTYFRSGRNNGSYKEENVTYRRLCFRFHKKECIVCGEDKIVAVHHYDENHQNNDPSNLIPLCPTHHCYVHSQHKDLVMKVIDDYRHYFITQMLGE